MTSVESSMQSYYAARASEYDKVYLKPERQADLRAIESWLPPIFTGASVLEVACGTGYWTQFLARVATSVVAVDAAPETMAIARSRMPEGKVEFLVGDAYDLPRRAEKFDAAFAGFWFSHIPKQRQLAFLAGLGHLLAPQDRFDGHARHCDGIGEVGERSGRVGAFRHDGFQPRGSRGHAECADRPRRTLQRVRERTRIRGHRGKRANQPGCLGREHRQHLLLECGVAKRHPFEVFEIDRTVIRSKRRRWHPFNPFQMKRHGATQFPPPHRSRPGGISPANHESG